MVGTLQPLGKQFPVINPDGTPTEYFIKWAQQRQLDIAEGITEAQAQALIDAWAAARDVIAGNGLDGGGNLGADITIDANASAILDLISSTRGTVLYRGASGWAGLAPGTSGHFLKTNGSGADPTWAAASGGGGSSYEGGPITVPLSSSYSWVNQGTSTVTDGSKALILFPEQDADNHGMAVAAPAAPFNIYCRVELASNITLSDTQAVDQGAGIFVRDSADNEVVGFYTGFRRIAGDEQNYFFIRAIRWTANGATFSSDILSPAWRPTAAPIKWVRMEVTSTDLLFYTSSNGVDWYGIHTEPLSSFIDAVTHYGFGAFTSGSTALRAAFSYFSTTAPT